ncbi:MAG: hypothetical protein RLZZ244_1678 [Verrucomicrobiota bacterium]|jgi:hypothetical protein
MQDASLQLPSKKKISYPVLPALRGYLRSFAREIILPIEYSSLRRFSECSSLLDKNGRETLWQTVIYNPEETRELHHGLRHTYGLLKASAESSFIEHLRVDRIDFCEFGNSQPFRIRIVNAYNDNQDYFYIKKADASRVYGLELEHLLSPNRILYFISKETLVEEHIVGIPGDQFISKHLQDPGFKEVRIAKEFVKFNERCFIRLLGDMRPCNYVVDVTPDFEEVQYRLRPLDFDQQCYEGRRSFYRPQFFKGNNPLVHFGMKHMDVQSMRQYQHEERSLMALRMRFERNRLNWLLDAMTQETLAPIEKVHQLRTELAEFYKDDHFLKMRTMGALVEHSLKNIGNLP